jgi:multidrug efflux pump subunit AcrB
MLHLSRFFLRNQKFTFVLTLFVLVFGLSGLLRLNSESYPAVDFAMSTIVTVYDGASTEDIETKITKPIEDELRGVAGIKDVNSVSQPGLSRIFVRGDIDNANVDKLMADLQRAVDRAQLPTDLPDPPLFTEIKSEEFPVVEIAIVGSNENRQRDLLADLLKEEIEDNKNILEVRPVGYQEREFEINLDVDKMNQQYVSVDEVLRAIERRNVNIPGGHLETETSQQLLRVEGKINDAKDIENILIRSNSSNQHIYLKDVATVIDGQEEATILTTHNGKEATLLIATKKAGADTLELVEQIDQKIELFRKKAQGKFEINVYFNEALNVKNRVSVLTGNALTGLALVIVFLLIFLPGRIGIMASLSLPIAVMATLAFMPMFGMNLDAITILALVIAIGMMVDNSVVISENYTRLRGDGMSSREAILSSLQTLWLPITATAFTTIAAFLPMLVTKGIMGEFIRFIPIIVTIALLMSLFESFFLLPMRLDGTASKQSKKQSDWFQRKFLPTFEKVVSAAVRFRYVTLGIFFAVLAGCFVLMGVFNTFILFPPDQTEIYAARVETTPGSTLEYTHSKVTQLVRAIDAKLGGSINHIVARTGISTLGPNDPKEKESENVGIILMYVNDDTKFNTPHTEVLDDLRSIPIEGYTVTYEAAINGPPVGEPVNATFRSNDSKHLETVIGEIKTHMEGLQGLRDVTIQDVYGDEEVFVRIDHSKADRLGLTTQQVGNAIRAAISGKQVSDVNLRNKEVDLTVRFKAPSRQNLEDLGAIMLQGRGGYLVPLSSFATFDVQPPTAFIKRFDYKRSKTLTANIDTDVISSVEANQALMEKFNELHKEYKDVSLVFGGEEENTKESLESLFNALILSLIGIFALLVFLFNSYLRPLVIMSTIPLGLVGFSIAFYLHGRPISFLALIGIIGLGGIIVNSGIVLITFIEELRSEKTDMPLHEILTKASGLRLRAVVVSSLTTISGLLPTAYGIGGSDAMLVPMTLAMAWGLTSGTLLTLIWVPCSYAIVEDVSDRFKRFRASFRS